MAAMPHLESVSISLFCIFRGVVCPFSQNYKLRVTTHVCTGTEVEQGRQKGFETQQPRYQARSERRHVRLGRDGWSDCLSVDIWDLLIKIIQDVLSFVKAWDKIRHTL